MDVRPGGAWRHVTASTQRHAIFVQLRIYRGRCAATTGWKTIKDEKRTPAPPTSVNTITLETIGLQTRWTLVSRFASFEDRDITARMGFGNLISQGTERMTEYLKTM